MASLALFDLDNTLLDRETAFALWARRFMETHRLPEEALAALVSADADGSTPRGSFFGEIRRRFGIRVAVDRLVTGYQIDYPACYSVDEATVEAVRCLRRSGWKLGIVTNGERTQQEKLRVTGLTDGFDAVCISAAVGCRKPDVAIFEETARMCGEPLSGWMVGDSASADIVGGVRAGLRTVWMSRGRTWDIETVVPDAIATTIPEAVEIILRSDAAGSAGSRGRGG